MKNPILSKTLSSGFSLIEMLVAVTLLLLMVGMGTAAFINFNDRQILQNSVKDLQVYFRTAQSRARAGDRPDTCEKLVSYGVEMTQGSNQVLLVAHCEGAQTEVTRSTYNLPATVSIESDIDIRFLGLHGGVVNPGEVTLLHNGQSYTFAVAAGGEITEGAFDE